MSLKLRRGTDAQRLVITPVEGELIYATDTKQIYVGDGTTLGGNAINNPLGLTPDLEGLTFTPAGHLTIKNQTANSDFNINVKPQGVDTNIISIDGTTGAVSVKRSLNVSRGITGDLTGSLFADDSTKIIDGVNSRGYFSSVNATAGINGDLTGSVFSNSSSLIIDGDNSNGYFNTMYISDANITRLDVTSELYSDTLGTFNTAHNTAAIRGFSFLRYRGTISNPQIVQNGDHVFKLNGVARASTGDKTGLSLWGFVDGIPTSTVIPMSWRFYTTGIGRPISPTLEIRGNGDVAMDSLTTLLGASIAIKSPVSITGQVSVSHGITGDLTGSLFADDSTKIIDGVNSRGYFSSVETSSYVKFGSYTTTQRDALTATNGMVIYNSSDNRFQGRQNGAWINLDDGSAA
jgi:hypothetical protein